MKKFPPHESSSRRRKKENRQSHRPGVEIHFLQSQLGRNQKAAIAELEKGRKAVLQINATKAGVRSEQRAGFIFEEIHASTYNAAARKAGGQILSQNAAAVVLKGSAPVAIAGCTIDLVCDAWKGELSGSKACKTVGRSASAWAGAEVGAALGAVAGPLGMIAGGVLGGILAGSGFAALFD